MNTVFKRLQLAWALLFGVFTVCAFTADHRAVALVELGVMIFWLVMFVFEEER